MNGFISIMTCPICNTDIKYLPDDIKEEDGQFYVECPCCMNDIKINK